MICHAALTKTNTYLFADDIKIFRAMTNKNYQDILQHDLSILEQWSDKWLLKFHPDRCKHMEIGKNNIGENEYLFNQKPYGFISGRSNSSPTN